MQQPINLTRHRNMARRNGMAMAKAVQSEQTSKELSEIGETLQSDAEERREVADRGSGFEQHLKWEDVNGTRTLVDTDEGGAEEPIEVTTSAPMA